MVLDISGTNYTKYVRGINLIASAVNSSALQYFLHNAHGDVVQLTNASGAVTKNYNYDAFGVEKDIAPNDTNAFRYCGEYWDTKPILPASCDILTVIMTVTGVAKHIKSQKEKP